MTTTLLDDRALSEVLQGKRTVKGDVFTTGLWYVRLCQAVIGGNRLTTGSLSAPIAALPEPAQRAAVEALIALPQSIGMLSLRDLAPTIARLRDRHQLNLLSIEALAAAQALNAQVLLTTKSPRLEYALGIEGLALVGND